MLQRAKNSEGSRLSVVTPDQAAPAMPAGEAAEHPATAKESNKEDGKPGQPAAKGGLGAVVKANRKRVLMGVAAVVAVAAVWAGYNYVATGRYLVSTDDAYVRADATTLAAKVSGYVSSIAVDDNAYVHAGDVIARIDNGDYRLAVDAARDKVATQDATVERIGRQIDAQQALVAQAQAQLVSAEAQAKRAELELARQQKLAGNAFASQQTLEQAESNRDQTVAAVAAGKAQVLAALANVDVLKAQQLEASRTLNELKTAQFARRSTASSATAPPRLATSCRPASASPAWCRSTTSISTPTSRRRN